MMYCVTVNHYDEIDGEVRRNYAFVEADGFKEVIYKLDNFFGEEQIESVSLDVFSPDTMLIFDYEDRELYYKVKKELMEKVIW